MITELEVIPAVKTEPAGIPELIREAAVILVLAAEVIPAAPERETVETEAELAEIPELVPELETAAEAMSEPAEKRLYDLKSL